MAISTEIQRLQNAKAALKTAINTKNDSSHQIDDETLDDYADFVDSIHTAIPFGYKELEYLENNGTQYIDTGIPLKTATDDVEVDFYVSNLTEAQSIFGARYSTTSRAYAFSISSTTNNPYRLGFGNASEYFGNATTGRHVAKVSHDGGTLTVDGTLIGSMGNASITTSDNCYVFAIKGNASNLYISTCRIYSFKIWRSGTLLMHLVPAMRMSDFVAGMYDKVSNTFFTNSGTGKFIIPSGQGVTLISKGISENGTYNASDDGADGYSQVFVNAKPEVIPQKDVNFYDYDGTILYSYTASEFAELTEMPANPIHDGLTSEGWNWSLADAKAQVSASGACDIGQQYITDDGKTRLYCHFTDDTKSFYFGIAPNGTVVVDWGDGSSTDTLTGTSRSAIKTVQHTYAAAGDYVITLTVSSGYFAFFGKSATQQIFRKAENDTANIHNANAACLKKVELGEDCYLGNYAFHCCRALESITLPKSLPLLGTNVFQYCHNLSHVTIPNKSAISSVDTSLFRYAYGLKSVSIPKYVTSVGNYALSTCYCMQRIVFPNSITSLGTGVVYGDTALSEVYLSNAVTSIPTTVFYQCTALTKLVIPATVTSIATKAFQGCYCMREYHFKSTTPPTLDNADAFDNMQSDCVIYVPSASLTAYQGATNWSTYASQMVGE